MTSKAATIVLRIGYALFLGGVLLSPFEFQLETAFLIERLRSVIELRLFPADVVDATRNVVLFAGWGILYYTTSGDGHSDSRRGATGTVLAALGTALALGLTAELCQLALPGRTPSLLDAVTNGLGGAGGALVGVGAVAWLKRSRQRPSLLGVPSATLAVPYLAAILVEGVFPLLRHAGPPGRHGGPAGRIAWSIEHFEWSSFAVLPLLDLVLFLPAGFLCAVTLRELGADTRTSIRWTLLVGIAIATVGELAHAPLARPMELGPALTHALAVAAGGWLTGTDTFARWLRCSSGGQRAASFIVLYGALLALWILRPFTPEPDPARWIAQLEVLRWLPLGTLSANRSLVSVADVLRSFFLFAPVGAVLAVRPLRTSGPVGGILPAVYAALVFEFGQTFIQGRFFAATDAIVSLAGAAIAWALVRRATMLPCKPVHE